MRTRPVRVGEIKRHLDGRIERFECRLVVRQPHMVVLRFDHEEAREADGFSFPAGSRSMTSSRSPSWMSSSRRMAWKSSTGLVIVPSISKMTA